MVLPRYLYLDIFSVSFTAYKSTVGRLSREIPLAPWLRLVAYTVLGWLVVLTKDTCEYYGYYGAPGTSTGGIMYYTY